MAPATRPCIQFQLGGDGYGIPLDCVREIIPAASIASVPLAPPIVKGVANVRGRVVTLIDMGRVYGRPMNPARREDDQLAIVLAAPWENLALYVHSPVEIADVSIEGVDVTAPTAETWSETSAGAPAVCDGRIMHLVSVDDVIARCSQDILSGFLRSGRERV